MPFSRLASSKRSIWMLTRWRGDTRATPMWNMIYPNRHNWNGLFLLTFSFLKISFFLERIPMEHIHSFYSLESKLFFVLIFSIRNRSRNRDISILKKSPPQAIEQMQDMKLLERAIRVGRPTNTDQYQEIMDSTIEKSKNQPILYISNIHSAVVEDDLRKGGRRLKNSKENFYMTKIRAFIVKSNFLLSEWNFVIFE